MTAPELDAEEVVGASGDPRVGAFYAFWNRARGLRLYPRQSDLDMVSVPRLVPNLFILDVLGGGLFRHRFIGSRIDDHLGVNLTGQNLEPFHSGRALAEITHFYNRVSIDGVLGFMQTRLRSERFEWLVYTRVGLPVADDGETINKIVGLFLFEAASEGFRDVPTFNDIDQQELGLVRSTFGRLRPPAG